MLVRLAIIIMLFCGACSSDIIHCPKSKPLKMKESRAKRGKKVPQSITASVKPDKHAYKELKKSDHSLKSAENIEEWDCPRPGSQKNNKIVKENKRRMEKNMRLALKKRSQTESDSTETILPQPQPEK